MQRDVFERSGNFSAVITVERNGKPVTLMKSLHTRDRSLAQQIQAKVNGLMTKIENGEKEIPPGIDLWDWLLKFSGEEKKVEQAKQKATLDEVLTEFLAGRTKRAPNTQILDRIYARHLRRFLGQERDSFLVVDQVDAQFFKDYQAYRYTEGVGVKTVNMELGWCSTLCKEMKKYWPTNPLADVKRDKNTQKFTRFRTGQEIEDMISQRKLDEEEVKNLRRHRILTAAEVERLLVLAKHRDEELYRMMCVAAFTGARRSEIARLRWVDVDLKKSKYITITGMKGSRHDQYTAREIQMHPELVKALEAQHLVSRHFDYVFPGEEGKEMDPKLMHKRWMRLIKGTDFEHASRWHLLRHSLASLMAAAGHDQREIDATIGHSTREMSMRYQHMLPAQKRAAASTLKAVKIKMGRVKSPSTGG